MELCNNKTWDSVTTTRHGIGSNKTRNCAETKHRIGQLQYMELSSNKT